MSNKKKEHKHGILGVLIFYTILVLILLCTFIPRLIQEEEGIEMQFGTLASQTATQAPKQTVSPTPPPSVSKPKPPTTPQAQAPVATKPQQNNEKLVTQDFEESLALKKKEEERKKKQKAQEAAKQREQEAIDKKAREEAKEKEEAERKEKEKAEQKAREEAERKAKEEAERKEREAKLAAIRQQTDNAFANSGTQNDAGNQPGNASNTAGSGGSPNTHGNTLGTGTGKSGYKLGGRNLIGHLPEPSKNFQEAGIVVVQIEVSREGIVTKATPTLKGSTTQNQQLWRAAKEAALKARFNKAPDAAALQTGSITYHFILN